MVPQMQAPKKSKDRAKGWPCASDEDSSYWDPNQPVRSSWTSQSPELITNVVAQATQSAALFIFYGN